MSEKKSTVTETVKAIAGEICECYCKYYAALPDDASDEEFDAHNREHCDHCPVMRL